MFVEIKEIHPGKLQAKYHDVMNFLALLVISNIPQGISIEVSINIVPNDSELRPLAKKLVECLKSQTKEKFISLNISFYLPKKGIINK